MGMDKLVQLCTGQMGLVHGRSSPPILPPLPRILKLVTDGFYREAISLHTKLHFASRSPHEFSFPPLLKACAKLSSPTHGRILHTHLTKTGFHLNIYTATALMDMYMKLNLVDDALKMFAEMPHRTLTSLNAAISGFCQNGRFWEAVLVFRGVGSFGYRPNSVTLASLLPACESSELCVQVHWWAVKLGVESDVYVGTSLVTVYSSCGEIILATKLFGEMPNKNVVSYNAMFSGLLQNGLPIVVLNVFNEMRGCSKETPNFVSLISAISACANLLYIKFGRQVHGLVIKIEVVSDVKVGTALIDMYSKCRSWEWAYNVFKELNGNRSLVTWNSMIAGMMLNDQSEIAVELFGLLDSEKLEPDSATWNSMICGFAQLDKGVEAFDFFKKMQSSGMLPSLKVVTSLVPACASLSNLKHGTEIHGHVIKNAVDTDEFMATALIDMYMKCGHSSYAHRIFDQFNVKTKDPAFWNVMIAGYGRNGDEELAFEIFEWMLEENVEPNAVTFVAVLSICSHTGRIEKGCEIFEMMTGDYGLNPTPEHICCMVDMLGRVGRLDEAVKLVQDVPELPTSVFASLLGSLRHHLHPEHGEEIANKISGMEPGNPSAFVTLSNIYAGLERWDDVERIRRMIHDRGLTKLPGSSSIEVA